jgi:hypothetical protein
MVAATSLLDEPNATIVVRETRRCGAGVRGLGTMKRTRIKSAFGPKTVVRRIGRAAEYYLTKPTSSAPNGEWWVLNPQHGFVSVSIVSSPGLLAAIAES